MEWFKIITSSMMMRVEVDDIVYVKADGNYCDLVLINGRSRKLTFQLNHFEKNFALLDNAAQFIRVGRSLIVNRNYVQEIDLLEQSIVFGGKHLLRVPTADDLRPRTGTPESLRVRDIYTVHVSRDALKALKEQLQQ